MPKKLVFNALSGAFDTISVVELDPVGNSPNGQGASLSGDQVLTLQPADEGNPGVVSTDSQSFAGNKTFVNDVSIIPDAADARLLMGGDTGQSAIIEMASNGTAGWAIEANPSNEFVVYNESLSQNAININDSNIIRVPHGTVEITGYQDSPTLSATAGATQFTSPILSLKDSGSNPVFTVSPTGETEVQGTLDVFAEITATGEVNTPGVFDPSTGNHIDLTVPSLKDFNDDSQLEWFDTGVLVLNDLDVNGNITGSNLSGTNTGDQTITLTDDVTGSGTGSFSTTISNNAVSNAKAADMPANTIKGNDTGSPADPKDLTVLEAQSLLEINPMVDGDIIQDDFSAANNTADQSITGFIFSDGVTQSFKATASVDSQGTLNLRELFLIEGIRTTAAWTISVSSMGDDSGCTFSIHDTTGQMRITTPDLSTSSILVRFKADTLHV